MESRTMRGVLIVLGIICSLFALRFLASIGMIGAGLCLAYLGGENPLQEMSDRAGWDALIFLLPGHVLTLIVVFFCFRAARATFRPMTSKNANLIWNTAIIILWFESLGFFIPKDHDRLIANPDATLLPFVLVTAFFVAAQIAGSRRLRCWPTQTPPPISQEANTAE